MALFSINTPVISQRTGTFPLPLSSSALTKKITEASSVSHHTLDKMPEALLSLICNILPIEDFNSLLRTSRSLQRICSLPLNLNQKADLISNHINVNIMPLFTVDTDDFISIIGEPASEVVSIRQKQIIEVSRLPQPIQVQNLHILAAQYWIENQVRIPHPISYDDNEDEFANVKACIAKLTVNTKFSSKCAIIKEYINKSSYVGIFVKEEYNLLVKTIRIYAYAKEQTKKPLYMNLIKHLLKAGANIDGSHSKLADPKFGTIAARIQLNASELLKLFLERGASPDGRYVSDLICLNRLCSPPLFILADKELCAIREKRSIFEAFFQFYPNPFITNSSKKTLTDVLQKLKMSYSYTKGKFEIKDIEDRIQILENYKIRFLAWQQGILRILNTEINHISKFAQIILSYV